MNLLRLQALFRLLLQHASSYAELGAAAASEYRGSWVRRTVLLLVALATSMAGLMALWGAGLVALWDTPWRLAYVAGSGVLLLAGAAVALHCALARRSAGPSSGMLRAELRKDLELFEQWKSTL